MKIAPVNYQRLVCVFEKPVLIIPAQAAIILFMRKMVAHGRWQYRNMQMFRYLSSKILCGHAI